MEQAFKKVYDLYLYGFLGEDEWVLLLVLFYNWAIENENGDVIDAWLADVRKDHPNPKGRYVKA